MGLPFSAEQLAAITAPLGPSLIVAGAGTGKTTVMAARVVWLVGTGQVEPGQVLGLTFTRRATGELRQKITDALASLSSAVEDDAPSVFTYDAFVAMLLSGQGVRLGQDGTGRLMTGAEPYQLADQAVDDPGFEPEALRGVTPSTLADKVMRLDQQMAGHMVTPDAVAADSLAFAQACLDAPGHRGGQYADILKAADVAMQRAEVVSFVRRYRELKRAAGVVEFADLQAAATRLAALVPLVGVGLRERFKVVLLDEYQDTSAAQAAMLASLFSGPSPELGRGHPVAGVGDPLQAIYGWRGAASDNMGDFGRLFPLADGTPPPRFPLTINRRSGPAVVRATNAVAARLRDEHQADVQMLEVDPSCPPARIEASSYDTWPQEVAAVTARIVQARRSGEASGWGNIAVLTRRNAEIPMFYQALADSGVPVEIVGLGGLLALPEIAAVVALLKLAADDADNPAAAQLVSGPACGLGPRDMAALARRARELRGDDPRLLDAIFDPGDGVSADGRQRLRHLGTRIRAMRRQRHEPAVELVHIAVELVGLGAELDVPSRWSASIAPQVRRFVSHVADHAGGAGLTLKSLLTWLVDEATRGGSLDMATPSQEDSVKLLTVHRAKGIEWQVVALPALAVGVFPNDRVGDNPLTNSDVLPFGLRLDAASLPVLTGASRDDMTSFVEALKAEQAASEDRLSYVAVSRAKTVLLASMSYWRPDAAKPRSPSRLFTLLAELAGQTAGTVALAAPSDVNPLAAASVSLPWPVTLPDDEQARLDALAQAVLAHNEKSDDIGLSAEDAARVASWQVRIARLETPPTAPELPVSLSASALLLGHRDPTAFFAGLARPMPRLVDQAAARGIAFHRWVEHRFALAATLDDPLDADIADIADLVKAFEAGPYANRRPLAVEEPFVAVIGGQQLRGRIDAVYAGEDGARFHLVDWKTSAGLAADPAQLAIYRLAWAQAMGCDVNEVDAVFYYVGQGRVERPALPDDIGDWVGELRRDAEREP